MYVVTVTFDVKGAFYDAFLRLVKKNASLSKEETGCRQFDVCTDNANNQVFLYEKYDSRQAFEHHLVTAHFFSFEQACIGKLDNKKVQCFEEIWPLQEE
ncbi:Autoinducer 2-degrading protein LsrG [Grimontia celer]|uniref:Autoinducer 2-degrading protein LsrG n=1 Tax=Grimontia celer TaxID=1796497 RepID=A0A128F437_9GAMM|nr:putative quinol monooxygenase [Grimontia celer]CZF81543.1 Autoinducer 2-degrading protein LsrG [Grimontia celer]